MKLRKELIMEISSHDSNVQFVEEDDSTTVFIFDGHYTPKEFEEFDEYTTFELTITEYDASVALEKENLSFEFTCPGKLSYDEVFYICKMLVSNYFSFYKSIC